MKKKLLIFHPALAPYRVDWWNMLNDLFDTALYFTFLEAPEQKFDQEKLKSRMKIKFGYHMAGFRIGVRVFRWGFISKIRKHRPDIIFAGEYSQSTLSLYLIKKIFGFKYQLYTICDDSLSIAQACSGIRKKMRNFLVRRLDGIILLNQDVADWYRSTFRGDTRYIVFPILAEENDFRNNLAMAVNQSNEFIEQYQLAGKKCLFFVGRLVSVKGVDRLITAFSKTSKQHPDAVLLIVGSGEELKNLEELCAKLGIAGKVIFTGRFDGLKLAAWYNIGQLFVLPSHYEPFGAVINEALLGGALVACSKNAGAASLVAPGINGELFDPYNVDELSSLMDRELQQISPQKKIEEIRPSKMVSYFNDYVVSLKKQFYN